MQSLEAILKNSSYEHNNEVNTQLSMALNVYLQQGRLGECAGLYQKLLNEWNNEETPHIQVLKQLINEDQAHVKFNKAFSTSLEFLFIKELNLIQEQFIHTQLNDDNRGKIELGVIQLMLQFLSAKGKNHLDTQIKRLSYIFHPDKKANFTPAMLWLGETLGEHHCFILIEECVKRIKSPATHSPTPKKRSTF